jgi:hypothetical protein
MRGHGNHSVRPRPTRDQQNRLFFDQIQHFFEIVAFAVIRIGQGDVAEEERQTMMLFLRTTAAEFTQVDLIGGEDEIELVEIGSVDLAGAERRQVIASVAGVTDGPRIGRVADVIVLRTGGIEFDTQAGLPGLHAQDLFRRRRTADVTHAHQEHPTGSTDLGHGSDLAAEALVVVQIQDVEPADDVLALGAGRG